MTIAPASQGAIATVSARPTAQKGKDACPGRAVPRGRVDDTVTESIASQLLTSKRVADLLRGLMNRQAKRDDDFASRLTALRGRLTEAEGRLGRLYQAIENGIADPNDVTLKDRVAAVRLARC